VSVLAFIRSATPLADPGCCCWAFDRSLKDGVVRSASAQSIGAPMRATIKLFGLTSMMAPLCRRVTTFFLVHRDITVATDISSAYQLTAKNEEELSDDEELSERSEFRAGRS
jgi:hypothetical protein